MDRKAAGVEMSPSVGHKTDPEHSDLQTMLKSPQIAQVPPDNSPRFPLWAFRNMGPSSAGMSGCARVEIKSN